MQILKQNAKARNIHRETQNGIAYEEEGRSVLAERVRTIQVQKERKISNERARKKRENVASRNSGSAIKRHYLVTKHNKTSPNAEVNDENKQ